MIEPLRIHKWYIGVDDQKKPVSVTGSFAFVEWAYFNGCNIPHKVIDGKTEPFKEAYKRVNDWFKLPTKIRGLILDKSEKQ